MRVIVPYCRDLPDAGFYQDFHQGITEALRELGHVPIIPSFWRIGEATADDMQALYRLVSLEAVDAVLDVCCWSCGLSQVALQSADGKQQALFEHFEVPWVGMLFDHPYNQAIHAIRARRLLATYPDRGHPTETKLVYPGLKLEREIFAPPAVRPASASAPAERTIDVLYIGNVELNALERAWRTTAAGASVADAIADAALAEPDRPMHASIRAALDRLGGLPPECYLYNELRTVEYHLRNLYRRDAVVALARSGVRMRIVGRGWEALGLPANVEHQDKIDYGGLYRLAAQAKICLDASTYLEGANDRAFAYALAGAVCFTNAGGYLRKQFDPDGMRFYSMARLDELADGVRALLARPGELRAAGEAAREKVLAAHTWRHRVEDILGALRR